MNTMDLDKSEIYDLNSTKFYDLNFQFIEQENFKLPCYDIVMIEGNKKVFLMSSN